MAERRVLVMVTSAVTVSSFLPPIVRALRDRGAVVSVASAALPVGSVLDGVTHHALPLARSGNPLQFVAALVGAGRLVRRTRPDVLVCATPVASLLGVVVGRLLRVPRVVHLAWGLRSESLTGPGRALVAAAERSTVRLAHSTLANSPSLRDAITGADPAVASKVECLGEGTSHGIDLGTFTEAPFADNPIPVIGFVGRVRSDKGIGELLSAAQMLEDEGLKFSLLVVGEVEEPELTGRLCALRSVEYRPYTDDVPALMRELDLLVLPSWREGFPNVVLEAAATGRPVITTDATGAVDSVRHEETGLVVPCRDARALATAMRRLLEDPHERAELGRAGRAWVERAFDSHVVCGRLAARLLDEDARTPARNHGDG